ncbi:hypothetical protein AMJ85_01800 [candidate division BRC1 bacterium SM23_51]|nr:MAG: hypothetical protein AMJ85_01800 [candidate division BRC1 bacterium SM23_51]
MNERITVSKQTYAGLFMVTLATLMYEILLTRIFSVTMWYHFAFVAISVAMFGMTVGAIVVYLRPHHFREERAKHRLAASSLLFAVSIVASFLIHLRIPFITTASLAGLFSIVATYVVISVPFVFSGICVCVALTKFPRQVSRLYAADLAGAAVGCILLIYTLEITDGPTAVIVVALFASIGSAFFAADCRRKKMVQLTWVVSVLLALFVVLQTILATAQLSPLRLVWVKGAPESRPLYEKWNSFSRTSVTGNPHALEHPVGWGLSPKYTFGRTVRQLHLTIDAGAATVLIGFDGDLQAHEYLKYDLTNLVHYVRPNAKVLVVGTGGGRDILSAMAFGQPAVIGVEINKDIINAVNRKFGDFTGHLDRHPNILFVNDEARSYIARSKDKYDIIQISLIDTFAATAAGAFVLTENSIYTIEAWKVFLEHLTPRGVLTVTRWYFRGRPGEIYRLTSLGSAALTELGAADPRKHIFVAKCMMAPEGSYPLDGVGTILVSREPFSEHDLDALEAAVQEMHFDLVLSPRFSLDSTFATIASGKDLDRFAAAYPINIAPPTDDSPFFFNMLRLRDVFSRQRREQGVMTVNMRAVFVLGALLITVTALTFLCIIVPLVLTADKGSLRGAGPLLLFFSAIGFGFMLIEISQMQRLIIFLGHPTYGLSVVLFSLLLSGGLGSLSTQRLRDVSVKRSAITRMLLLLCALLVFGVLTPYATRAFQASTTVLRILVATGILFALGLFMGMAFPLGMKIASKRSAALTPWLWGMNGATSVCASVLAVAIALSASISTAFWTGFFCYAVALLTIVWASRSVKI